MNPTTLRASERYIQTLVNENSIDPTLIQKSRQKVSFRDVQVHERDIYGLHTMANGLSMDLDGWDELGVTPEARDALQQVLFDEDAFSRVFVHPKVIIENPELFSYYRALSGFSENN